MARVRTLPATGSLHQLTQVFSDFGYEPKRGSQIGAGQLPATVSGSQNRVVYAPPANTNAPAGAWTTFTYTVFDGTAESLPGIVWVLPPHERLVHSGFSEGADGWRVETNGAAEAGKPAGGLVWEPYSRGALNFYVLATDAEIHADRVTGDDRTRWSFVAPAKFLGNQVASYGGAFEFTLGSAAGDFAETNRNADATVVVLGCTSCAAGKGIRLARFADSTALPLDGRTRRVSLPLTPASWKKDPKSTILAWTTPSDCELVEVLSGLTSIHILGDHTRWYESVALDDVDFKRGPGVPIKCVDQYY